MAVERTVPFRGQWGVRVELLGLCLLCMHVWDATCIVG